MIGLFMKQHLASAKSYFMRMAIKNGIIDPIWSQKASISDSIHTGFPYNRKLSALPYMPSLPLPVLYIAA